MNNADKLFYELGFEKIKNTNIGYFRKEQDERLNGIIFFLDKKSVAVHYDNTYTIGITMEDLKAINMKCLELRLVR